MIRNAWRVLAWRRWLAQRQLSAGRYHPSPYFQTARPLTGPAGWHVSPAKVRTS